MKIEINGEKVSGIYPRENNAILFVTEHNHYLMSKSRDETWRIENDSRKTKK